MSKHDRDIWGIAFGFAGALALCWASNSAVADESEANACNDCWTVSTGVVALARETDEDKTVIAVEPGTFDGIGPVTFGFVGDDIPIVKTGDLNTQFEIGGSFKAERAYGNGSIFEISGLHVNHHDSIRVGGAAGNTPGLNGNPFANRISLPFDDSFKALPNSFLHGVSGVDLARAEYESDLYDVQFNRWRPYNDSVSLLFGLRYTLLSEDFNLRGVDGVGQPEGRTEYEVRARNQMIGPQLGAAVRKKRNRLGFGLTGKIAPMLNLAYQKQRLKENPVSPLNFFSTNGFRRKTSDYMLDLSYIAELGAEVTVRVSDRVNLNFGYMAMFLGQVATAPDNFDFSTKTKRGEEFVDSTANVLYHGGTAMARMTIKLN